MATINGQRGAFPQPGHFGRSEAGAYTVKIFEGTLAEIYQVAGVVEASGGLWEITESFSGAKHRMECRFPLDFNTTEAPVQDWELFSQEVEKDVLEADLAAFDGISRDEKEKIRAAIDNPQAHQSPALVNPTAIILYLEMLDGLRSVRVAVPHLRHTQTVSTLWAVGAALTNVTKIISTPSLRALESVPGSLLFNLPSGSSSRTRAQYGWYKKFPTVRIAAGHRIQLEQEWEYGLWSTLIYGNPL